MDMHSIGRSADAGHRRHGRRQAAALAEAGTLTKIPVLPVSYGDAQPLLEALKGRWRRSRGAGALPITYHVRAGAAAGHLKVKSNWDMKSIYDVIAAFQARPTPTSGSCAATITTPG